jgi:hypothetical protein
VATAGALREVTVAIDPPDASVDVAGRPVNVNAGGFITISGELGSLHHVRVYKDKIEFRADVAITAKGPIPDKLALPAAKPAGSTVSVAATTPVVKTKEPGPAGTQSTATPTTAKTTTKPPNGDPGPDRDFD